MDNMTAAMTCMRLTNCKKSRSLTVQEAKELADAQAFLQSWAKNAAANVKVLDPCGLLKEMK